MTMCIKRTKKTRYRRLSRSRQGRFSNDERMSFLDFLEGLKRYSDGELVKTWKYFKCHSRDNSAPLYIALEEELYLRGLTDSSE